MLVIPTLAMPEDCWHCVCNNYEFGYCEALADKNGSAEDSDTWSNDFGQVRRKDCPLYEVPEWAKWVLKKFKNKSAGDNSGQVHMEFDEANQFVGFNEMVQEKTNEK